MQNSVVQRVLNDAMASGEAFSLNIEIPGVQPIVSAPFVRITQSGAGVCVKVEGREVWVSSDHIATIEVV